MKELTDDKNESIYFEIMKHNGGQPYPQRQRRIDAARAAYAACFPFAVEEAVDLTEYAYGGELDRVVDSWRWDKMDAHLDHMTVKQMLRDSVCIWASNRLVTLRKKPDPAVEAALAELVKHTGESSTADHFLRPVAERIVAAVRKSDGSK